jgi:hypothetical protein
MINAEKMSADYQSPFSKKPGQSDRRPLLSDLSLSYSPFLN